MLEKISKALLLSDVPSFADNFKHIAEECDVSLDVESEWSAQFRVSYDTVIFGSKYINKVNRSYYPKAVLILKEGESPAPYIKEGISRFIFDYKNVFELCCSFYREPKTVVHASSKDLETIVKDCGSAVYCFGDYDFDFAKNKFKYKGKLIYMADSTKRYIAEWLLNGHKDNKKRMILCNLRKKFGADFLKNIDRFGQIKE